MLAALGAGMTELHARTGAGEFSLTIPPEPASVSVARMFAAAIARHYECGEDAVEDVKLAISEACTNAIKAHRDADLPEPIVVRATCDERTLGYVVVDSGPGSGPARAIEEVATPPAGLYEGSLGLTLIRSLFPDATITPNDGRGMTARFAVDLAGAREAGD